MDIGRQIKLLKIDGFDQIPPTPAQKYSKCSFLTTIRDNLVAYASGYGFPVSYIQEQNGDLIQNIFPIKKTESQQISSSSKIELGLHTETAFHPYKPSHVHLLCLREDPLAVTTYAYVDEIMGHLKPKTIDILTRPWFITSIDDSFRTHSESNMELPCFVLRARIFNKKLTYEIIFDEALMRGINDEANDALEQIKGAIMKSIREIVLRTGDLLTLDNKTTIHGRRPFNARYDGTDRWLLRVLSIDYAVPRQHKSGHTIITKFQQSVKF